MKITLFIDLFCPQKKIVQNFGDAFAYEIYTHCFKALEENMDREVSGSNICFKNYFICKSKNKEFVNVCFPYT